MSYDCPKCEWGPPIDNGFYYVKNKKIVNCTRYDEKNDRIYAKPPKGFDAYPKYENYEASVYASYEFGINGHDWDEVHKCPKCDEEFSFSNSDF